MGRQIKPRRHLSISLTRLGKPLVQVSDTAAVVFERIAFENSRERGVVMTNSANCEIRACLFRNLGRNAVDITGGSKCGVVSTEVYDTGAGGVNLDGGDRKTLTPSAHYVRNCEFHHFNRIEKTYRPAVDFKGVGQILSHSYIHHSDAGMILFAGNDHLIEYNEFAYGMQHADEMGAIYTGRDPSACGTVIRYNYFHHMGSQLGGCGTECISFDDGSGFCRIYGNVFYKSADGHIGGNGAVGLRIENNVFIRNKRPIKISNWGSGWHEWVRGKGRKKSHNIPDKIFNDTVNILEPPYSTRYPELVEMYHSGPKADRFKSNKIVTNVFVDEPLGKLPDPAKNLALKGDPGFENMAQENFTLKKDSVVFEKLPDFKPIPFEKIGLQRDEYRK